MSEAMVTTESATPERAGSMLFAGAVVAGALVGGADASLVGNTRVARLAASRVSLPLVARLQTRSRRKSSLLALAVWLRVLWGIRHQGAGRAIETNAVVGAAIVGGLLFTLLIALWLTSSLWFFRQFGIVV